MRNSCPSIEDDLLPTERAAICDTIQSVTNAFLTSQAHTL